MHSFKNWYFGYQCCFPSLEIDNLDFYNSETGEPLHAGYNIKLCKTSVTADPAIHLSETKSSYPTYPDADTDGDGYVDGTTVKFDGDTAVYGVQDTSNYKNLNPTKPPEYIKITGNDGVDGAGGYDYCVPRTDGLGVSDGGYYDEVENNGGFFGDTKFITEENTYLGTDHTNTETFSFE
jgi:hypothetical protein